MMCSSIGQAQLVTLANNQGWTKYDQQTYQLIDQIPQAFFQYNKILKFLGSTDTIQLGKEDGKFRAIFRGQDLPKTTDNKLYMNDSLLIQWDSKAQDYDLQARTSLSNGSARHLIFVRSLSPNKDNKYGLEEKLIVFHSRDNQKVGDYKKYALAGHVIESGSYCLTDEIVRDTIITVDPKTYEEKISIQEIGYRKCGTWTSYDDKGAILEEKEY